ncbi:MAG: hypothetical protein N4A35_05455 [Flavobacteriales bacterium]|jgi:hypothetical protein|nr:hypothetical protein [Flavobacteriales bacterium]
MANLYTDILTDDTGDIAIRNGDFVIGDSLHQEVDTIVSLNQGELKQFPLIGPNIISMLKSSNIEEVKRKLKLHLELDNKQVGKMKVNNGVINIDATNI